MQRALGVHAIIFLVGLCALACSSKVDPATQPIVHRDADLAYELRLPGHWKATEAQGMTVASFSCFPSGSEINASVMIERTSAKTVEAYVELLEVAIRDSGGTMKAAEPVQLGGQPAMRFEAQATASGQTHHQVRYVLLRGDLAFQVLVLTLGAQDTAWQAALAEIERGITWLPGTPKRPRRVIQHVDTLGAGWVMRGNVWLGLATGLRVDMSHLTTEMGSPEDRMGAAFVGTEPVSGVQVDLSVRPLPAPPVLARLRTVPTAPGTITQEARFLGKPLRFSGTLEPGGASLTGFAEHAERLLELTVLIPSIETAQTDLQGVLDRFTPLSAADSKRADAALALDTRRWVAPGIACYRRVCRDREAGVRWTLPSGAWRFLLGDMTAGVSPGARLVGVDGATNTWLYINPWTRQQPGPLVDEVARLTGSTPKGTVKLGDKTLPILEVRKPDWYSAMVPIAVGDKHFVIEVMTPETGTPADAQHAHAVLGGLAALEARWVPRKSDDIWADPAFGIRFGHPPGAEWKPLPSRGQLGDHEFVQAFGPRGGELAGFVRGAAVPFPAMRATYFDVALDALRQRLEVKRDETPLERRVGAYRARYWEKRLFGQAVTFGTVEGPGLVLLVQAGPRAQWERLVDSIEFLDD